MYLHSRCQSSRNQFVLIKGCTSLEILQGSLQTQTSLCKEAPLVEWALQPHGHQYSGWMSGEEVKQDQSSPQLPKILLIYFFRRSQL